MFVAGGKKKMMMARNEVERELKWAMKQKNLRPKDTVNQYTDKYGEKRLRTSNRCNTGTLSDG